MTTNGTLIAKLEQKIEHWEALALEIRVRADQRRSGDMDPTYLYECADQLERNAQALRDVISEVEAARGNGES